MAGVAFRRADHAATASWHCQSTRIPLRPGRRVSVKTSSYGRLFELERDETRCDDAYADRVGEGRSGPAVRNRAPLRVATIRQVQEGGV